jgi:hypothetical protein
MKALFLFVGIVASACPVLAQISLAPQEALLHVITSFDLVVHAPFEKTAPLFGPEGERAWAGKHWNPEFIHPQPAADIEGAVFTIQHGPYKAVWVNTLFDREARHFQYVYFLPSLMVTVIDVRFEVVNTNSTGVHVVYTRTALTPEGNQHVAAMSEGDKTAGPEWQKSIDEYFPQSGRMLKP